KGSDAGTARAGFQWREIMEKLRQNLVWASITVATVCACNAAFAQAGGNGNGGNGSGGSHGAATAGMTYHSEPVSSPWNRVPGDMANQPKRSDKDKQSMSPDGNGESVKTGQ
ncbi:hypothetical protein, partial [Paraburkholderia caledonica]